MRVLGLIPARAGSLRLPNKNLVVLGGRSLIARAIDTAMACPALDLVAVSTDSQRIATIAGAAGASLIDRPAELSRGDQPHMLSVVSHALAQLERVGCHFHAVALLQPTSPFRTADDIESCVSALDGEFDTAISVTDPEPFSFFYRGGDNRQQLMNHGPPIAIPNGAVYVMTVADLRAGKNWYHGAVFGHWMPRERSIDINSHADLTLARSMVLDHA